jgi:hypothetical protein
LGRPGATYLLEAFVETIVMHRFYIDMWKRDPGNRETLRSITMCNNSLAQLATKLRIANTSVYDKKAGILQERGDIDVDRDEPLHGSNVTKLDRSDVLYGGGKVRF